MKKVTLWLRQPTTIAGLSTLGGTLVAVTTGQLTIGTAVPLLVGAIVGIVIPDNTAAVTAVQLLAKDTVAATAAFHAGAAVAKAPEVIQKPA